MEFCKNIIQKGIEGKNIFCIDETKMDIALNTKGESIRISPQIKNKLKKGDEEGYKKNMKNMKHQQLLLVEYPIMVWVIWFLILLNGTIRDF